MITIPISKRTSFNYTGDVPRPDLASGKRNVRFCAGDFDSFFVIPAGAKDLRLVLTKSAHEDAYELKYTKVRNVYSFGTYTDTNYTLDEFEVPGMYGSGRLAFNWAVKQGYTHVRVDYREGGR